MCKFCPMSVLLGILVTRRGGWIPWNWSYRQVWAKWVLRIEPAFFGRAISLAHTLCVCVSKSMNVQKSKSFGNTLCPARGVPGDGTLCRDPQNHLNSTLMFQEFPPVSQESTSCSCTWVYFVGSPNLPRSKYCVPRTQFLDDSFSFILRVGYSILRHSWFQPRYLLQILDSWSHLPS